MPQRKSSILLYKKLPKVKYKYRNSELWRRGYDADAAGKNVQKIQERIKRQLDTRIRPENNRQWEVFKLVYGQQARNFRNWQTVPTRRAPLAIEGYARL